MLYANEKQQMLEITEKMSDVTAQDALKIFPVI